VTAARPAQQANSNVRIEVFTAPIYQAFEAISGSIVKPNKAEPKIALASRQTL
jgi:hypothetical protein